MPAKSRKTAGGMSVMDLDTAGFYRPRTNETRCAGAPAAERAGVRCARLRDEERRPRDRRGPTSADDLESI